MDRFPAPRQMKNEHDVRFAVIDEISRQANEAWGRGDAQVAFDFMRVSIPARSVSTIEVEEEVEEEGGSGDTRQQRGRGTRGRGRRVRGNQCGKRAECADEKGELGRHVGSVDFCHDL